MKFGIITHYDVHNHGAILQMNALKKVLEQRVNIAADILQYTKNYDFMGCDKKYKYEFSIKSIKRCTRQTLWGGRTDANPKLSLNDI